MAGKSWTFCGQFFETLSTCGPQMGLVFHGRFRKSAPAFLPSYLGTVAWKVHRTFQVILVAFWVPDWLPKLPSFFPDNFQNFHAIIKLTLLY